MMSIMKEAPPPQNVRFPRWLMVTLALLLLLLLAGGAWFYRTEEQHQRQHAEAELQAIADVKAAQIAAWRAERLADAAVLAQSPQLSEGMARWLADPRAEDTRTILASFRAVQEHYGYDDVLLVDTTGEVRLSLNGQVGPLHPDMVQVVAEALRDRQPVLSDLHAAPGDLQPHIDVVAPLFAGPDMAGEPVGAVILQSDAGQFLYPLIQSWPAPSQSAETLLVRRDGDHVLFLNELRHQPGEALTLRIPLSETDVPAVMAVLGTEGVVRGRDYRGVRVLSVIKPIPDSPWFMVTKVDEAEALAAWRSRSTLIVTLILGAMMTAAIAAGLVWQSRLKTHYQALFEADAARRESEEQYRQLVEMESDAIFLIANDTGQILQANSAASELYGYSREELLSRKNADLSAEPEKTQQATQSPPAAPLQPVRISERLHRKKDGTVFPADISARFFDWQGRSVHIAAIRDISERKRAEEVLQESEAKYRLLAENTLDAIWQIGLDMRFTYVNPASYPSLGYTPEEFVGTSLAEHCTPEAMAKIAEITSHEMAHLDQHTGVTFETHLLHKSGHSIPVEIRAKILFDEEQRPFAIQGVSRDITERKQAEEALQESEERFRVALKNSGIVVATVDDELRYTWIYNPHPAFDPAAVIGKRDDELVEPDNAQAIMDIKRAVLETGRGVRREFMMSLPDGIHWYDFTAEPLRDDSGRVVGLTTAGIEITERRQAEEALAAERDLLRMLVDTIPDAIYFKDARSRFTRINRAHARMLGIENLEEALGKTDLDFFPPDFARDVQADEAELMQSGKPVIGKIERLRDAQSKQLIWVSATKVPLTDSQGRVTGLVGITRNIDEVRRAQEALAEREAMLQSVLRAAPIGIGLLKNRAFDWVNEHFLEVMGYPREEVEGQDARTFYESEAEYERVGAALYGGPTPEGSHGIETRLRRKDGSAIDTVLKAAPLDPADPAAGVIVTSYDISERKRVEEAQRESEARLSAFVRALPDLSFIMSEEGRYIEILAQHDDLLYVDADRLRGKLVHEVLPQPYADLILEGIQRTLRTGSPQVMEYALEVPAGHRWFEARTAVMETPQGEPARVVMVARDTTERKQAEEALRESEARLRTILDNLPIGVALNSVDPLAAVYMNDNFASVYRTTREALAEPGAFWEAVYEDVEFREQIRKRVLDDIASGDPARMQWDDVPITREGEETAYISARSAPIEGLKLMLSAVWETTERKRSEDAERDQRMFVEALAETAALLNQELDTETVFETLLEAIGRVVPHTGTYVMLYEQELQRLRVAYVCKCYANNRFEPPGIGRTYPLAELPHLRQAVAERAPTIVPDTADDADWRTGFGTDWVRSYIGAPIFFEGRLLGVLSADSALPHNFNQQQAARLQAFADQAAAVIRNTQLYEELESYSHILEQAVEERTVELQAANVQLRELDRMKDEFISTAAHELRTPLTSVQGFSEILLTRELDAERQRRYLTTINEQSTQLAEIIDALLDISRLEAGQGLEIKSDPVDTAHLLAAEVLPFIDAAPQHHFRLEGLSATLVRGDPFRLGQVIRNLVSNAIKYSPEGGDITISSQVEGEFLAISVQDEGIGLTPDQQAHMFEKFYRVDAASGSISGTGLGLAISRLIVEQHGGTIWLESEAGKGSTATFTVPLFEENDGEPAP